MEQECPECGNKALRERSTPSLKNIRLRKVGDRHASVVCDNCSTTFTMEMKKVDVRTVEIEESEADSW